MSEPKAIASSVSRSLCALAFASAGILHFVKPQIFCKIMPAYLPYALELVYVSGLFEIAGAVGLLIPALRRYAVWGLLCLLIAVFPANINMALHPELTPDLPVWLLYLRLPLQPVLMIWVWSNRLVCRHNRS
jgi:uncharacterized membrane protein